MAKKRRRPAKKPRDPEKEAAKKARRLERQAREAAERRKAARRRWARQGALGAVVVVVGGLLVFLIVRAMFPPELPGVERPPDRGREHLAAGQTFQYASATPTSGPHAPSAPPCGIVFQQMPAEFAVHALEHGVVVIWYQEQNDDIAAGLSVIVGRFDDHVILSPNTGLDQPVVATAWNRLKSYAGVDPEIEEFIETYRNRGPERVACPY